MIQEPGGPIFGSVMHQGPFTFHGVKADGLAQELNEMVRQRVATDGYAFRCENCRQHFAHIALMGGRVMEIVIPQNQIDSCGCNKTQPYIIQGLYDNGSIN